ncbi:MAG TPA: DMT family transporter [Actinomycetota bacterium]|nr:DMT family transporter [Actinomycetota bacterium]
MRRHIDPGLLLLPTPILWGITFPAGKLALDHLPPLVFMAWTRGLGFLSILLMVPLLKGREKDHSPASLRDVIAAGLLLGALIFVAYILQTEGLKRTTATNAGFITGLYVVFTPILAALLFGLRVPRAAWLAVAISVFGLALLSIRELDDIRVYGGDLLVLAGAVVWAGHVVGVSRLSPKFSAWSLSLSQMGVTALLQILATSTVGIRTGVALSSSVFPLLFLTGVLGSGVAYTLQIIGQRTLTATRAVVLLAGEALFAAVFSAIWIGERLSAHQWVGALLVLAAMTYSEVSARRPPEERVEPASAV